MRGKIFTVVLILIILGLGGYIAYDKVLNKEAEEPEANESVEISNNKKDSIVGEYKYETTDANSGMIFTIVVDFMEDGTYYKKESSTMSTITYGTYTVNNNTVTLNQIFVHQNEVASGGKFSKTYTYQLNADGSITETFETSKRVLTKINGQSSVKNEFLEWLMDDVEEYSKSLAKL